ncbi:MAG: AAC(3) family N-acetyltransferase [Planctomycetota bacterium]|jgi:aminoglycoside 3-N-acetyltransferase
MAKQEYTFTKDVLVDDFRALGLTSGDTVMMHSNASSVGPARQMVKAPDTGMAWVLEALMAVLGSEGTLLVPTFSSTFKENCGPSGLVWNPKETPSRVGSLTNYVWKKPGAFRSDHPTHSVAAIGGRAEEVVKGHSWRDEATTFDRGGPWGKLADWDGKVLWLGTDMRTQTAVHVVEEWMALPYMEESVALVDDGGETKEVKTLQSPNGPRDFYKKDSKSALAWEAAGLGKRGKVCRADCQLMGMPEFVDWLWAALLKDPALLLHDNPEQEWSVKARKETAEHLASFTGSWRR